MDIILFGYLSEKNNIFFSFQFTNLVPLMKHWECCGHKGCIVIRRVWFKLPLRRNISSLITPVNEMVLTQNDVIWAMLTNLQGIYCWSDLWELFKWVKFKKWCLHENKSALTLHWDNIYRQKANVNYRYNVTKAKSLSQFMFVIWDKGEKQNIPHTTYVFG